MILRILTRGAMHGWGIMQRLRNLTGDVFQVAPGSLFPAPQRIEERGLALDAITPAGRRGLAAEQKHWSAITLAVTRVLDGA